MRSFGVCRNCFKMSPISLWVLKIPFFKN
ncbi:hypothetical protein KVD45_01200 [Helicobacter pylori]|nr:hypothetical protein KVD45_01200 [Helicobacter pylori]